ncbi:MAG: GNAT family N-acetyltransferase [Clostridium sp.]|uniref:GNAT family N-acetyltransferase n=1 Tax=Clostridium sp. TaxID=1506 RepID=UPI003D6C87FF
MDNNALKMRNFLELSGNLVYLKKQGKEHIEKYWEMFEESSVEVTVFTGTQQVFSKSNLENFVENISSDNSRVDFLIFSKETNKMVGEVVINDIYRNNRSGSMRILINRKEDFNKGYGSEALILALHYGFGMFNLHRIELEVYDYNERGIHVYEKTGFKKEGIKRDGWFFNHKYYDVMTMSILEDEFRWKYISSQDSLREFL